ncbi:MAG: bifunctional adenosylcobinamide kinase/adenosylcobinamide-phosphate guanylyltransferase [Polyangia bacterium]
MSNKKSKTFRLVLVGGGARSGKSTFALAMARRLGKRRAFIATAKPSDEEMAHRITRHREERGDDFATIEEPVDVPACLAGLAESDVVIVDCLTLWIANLLFRGDTDAQVHDGLTALVSAARERRWHLVLVTNEVGMGLVPETALGRRFRDLTGFAHQRLAREADEVFFAALGLILRLSPGPIETCDARSAL